jgi:hypothetical protein
MVCGGGMKNPDKRKMRNIPNLLLVLQGLTLRVWSGLLTMVAFRTIVAYAPNLTLFLPRLLKTM